MASHQSVSADDKRQQLEHLSQLVSADDKWQWCDVKIFIHDSFIHDDLIDSILSQWLPLPQNLFQPVDKRITSREENWSIHSDPFLSFFFFFFLSFFFLSFFSPTAASPALGLGGYFFLAGKSRICCRSDSTSVSGSTPGVWTLSGGKVNRSPRQQGQTSLELLLTNPKQTQIKLQKWKFANLLVQLPCLSQ